MAQPQLHIPQNFSQREIDVPDTRAATDRLHTRKHGRSSGSDFKDRSRKPAGKIRLTDLCAEDKAKIGELARKLAEEKTERQLILSKREQEKQHYDQELRRLRIENEKLLEESERLKQGFKESLGNLQSSPQRKPSQQPEDTIEESSISLSETQQHSVTFRNQDFQGSQETIPAIETPKAGLGNSERKSAATSPIKIPAPSSTWSQSTGTQTTIDKSMQSDTPLVTPRALSHFHSRPSTEIKTLRQDIASLSMSLHAFGESVPSSVRGGKHFRFDHPMASASPVIKNSNPPSSLASPLKEFAKTQGEPLERSLQPHFDIYSPRDFSIKPSKLTLNIPRSPIPERHETALDESQTVDYNDDLFSIIEELEAESRACTAFGQTLTAEDLNNSRMVEMIEEMERQTGRPRQG